MTKGACLFEKLKHRNDQRSVFNNGILPAKFSRSPGTSSSVTKTNEATRLVRCKHCGWICDRERDIRSEDGSYTGYGIKYHNFDNIDSPNSVSAVTTQRIFSITPGASSVATTHNYLINSVK